MLLLVLNINTHGGMGFTLNEILATPRGVQELMNQKGSSHEIVVHIDGVRTFDRSRVSGDFVVIEQRDANTFVIHPPSIPDELYQVSSRADLAHQIISERITGKVGRKVQTSIESMTWVDEEILPRLEEIGERFPNGMVYLTGSIDIDDPEQISIQAKPQQLATAIKQGRKLEFNSCPLGDAIGLLGEQWGSGQVRVRGIIEN